jgi:hypothetical protein
MLTKEEMEFLICQIGISESQHLAGKRGGNRHLLFAFTEAGVAMFSRAHFKTCMNS